MVLEKYLSFLLVAATFLLILAGGIVHNTGSSLACPDWPLCYGQVLPEMKGGVAVEHTHRLIATGVGLLTVILALLLSRKRGGEKKLVRLAWLAVVLVVIQGVLGGITVLLKLPTLVSTAHLALSLLFFSLVIVIAWRVSGGSSVSFSRHPLIPLTAILVYLQSILGAAVRHTGSGIVCPTIPFCHGALWSISGDPRQILHMTHRWSGVAVFLFTLALPFFGGRSLPFFVPPILALLQVVLGLVSVVTVLGVVPLTAHLGVAALLLGVMVALWVGVRRTA